MSKAEKILNWIAIIALIAVIIITIWELGFYKKYSLDYINEHCEVFEDGSAICEDHTFPWTQGD